MAPTESQLGNAVAAAIYDIFFQPDDEISLQAIDKHLDQDIVIRINGEQISRDMYKNIISTGRSKSLYTVLTDRELITNGPKEGRVDGTVSHHTDFLVKDKETGAEREAASVTIITAAWNGDNIVLRELLELIHNA